MTTDQHLLIALHHLLKINREDTQDRRYTSRRIAKAIAILQKAARGEDDRSEGAIVAYMNLRLPRVDRAILAGGAR